MKEIKPKNHRRLEFSNYGTELVISEKIGFAPSGGTRLTWSEERVVLSRDELVKALAFMDSMERDAK